MTIDSYSYPCCSDYSKTDTITANVFPKNYILSFIYIRYIIPEILPPCHLFSLPNLHATLLYCTKCTCFSKLVYNVMFLSTVSQKLYICTIVFISHVDAHHIGNHHKGYDNIGKLKASYENLE